MEWINNARLADGSTYRIRGSHILRIRNGKIVAFHAYLDDTAAVDDALDRLAAVGVVEAAAAPIGAA